MPWTPLPDEADQFILQPVEIDTPDAVYPRHILTWRRPYLGISDGTGRVWATATAVAAEQDLAAAPPHWQFTLDTGAVWDVRMTTGCASCGGNSPVPRWKSA